MTGIAVRRAAAAMLHLIGGSHLQLRIVNRSADARGLGLGATDVSVAVVADAIVRTGRSKDGTRTLEALVPSEQIRSAFGETLADEELLARLTGLEHGGRVWKVKAIEAMTLGGVEYVYRLTGTE